MITTHLDPFTVKLILIFMDGHQFFTLVALTVTAIFLVAAGKHF